MQHVRFRLELCGRERLRNAAALHDVMTIGERCGESEILLHEHDREAAFLELADDARERNVRARTLLIAFSSDWLYPPADSEELAAALRAAGKDVELHVIDAPYGHDCFLLEEARQTPLIRRFLAG